MRVQKRLLPCEAPEQLDIKPSLLTDPLMQCRRSIVGEGVPEWDGAVDRKAAEEVLLDENLLAKGHDGFSLGGFEVCCLASNSSIPERLHTHHRGSEDVFWDCKACCKVSSLWGVTDSMRPCTLNVTSRSYSEKTHNLQVSEDHRRLAYAVDLTGGEQYELYAKDIETGMVTQLTQHASSGSMAWALDSSTLFFVTLVRSPTTPLSLSC